MELLNIPNRYKTPEAIAALDSIDERLLKFSAVWSGDYGAVLTGPTGCGKSLSAAVALSRVTLGLPRYWSAWVRADVLTRLSASRDHAGDLARIKSVHVLVIDEMGFERFPESVLEVIGDRYDRNLPTVVTTGLKPEEFISRYADSTVRKIIEPGDGFVVNCWGTKQIELLARSIPERLKKLQAQAGWSGSAPIELRDCGLLV